MLVKLTTGLMERQVVSGMPQVHVYNKPMASVRSSYSQCGTRSFTGTRIAGGTEAVPGEFPWTVALFKHGQHFCGGSLISPTHILTAAHCVAT
jgi:secreted trypsin-like serine protease